MLAPSKENSTEVISPVVPPTPVRIMTEYLLNALQKPLDTVEEATTPTECPSTPTRSHPAIGTRSRIAVNELKGATVRFLVSDSPIKLSAEPPDMPVLPITAPKIGKTAKKNDIAHLLQKPAKTALEQKLQNALEERDAVAKHWKTKSIHLQAMLVLQRVYCRRVRVQLKSREGKSKKRSGRKLKNLGLGWVITANEYYEEVMGQQREQRAKRCTKRAKISAHEQLVEALKMWEAKEQERLIANDERKEELEEAKTLWKAEKEEAKAVGEKVKDWIITHPEPKRADPNFLPIPKAPKPTLAQFLDEEDEDNVSDDEEEESNNSDD